MWEEGIRIYGTLGVYNNFPRKWCITSIFNLTFSSMQKVSTVSPLFTLSQIHPFLKTPLPSKLAPLSLCWWDKHRHASIKILSPFLVCVLKILSILKRKYNGLIPHWKMSVSKRGLKFVLYIQELGSFGYTPLSVSLRPFPLSPYVCIKNN